MRFCDRREVQSDEMSLSSEGRASVNKRMICLPFSPFGSSTTARFFNFCSVKNIWKLPELGCFTHCCRISDRIGKKKRVDRKLYFGP